MARKLDQIIVIDLEATCWENTPPPGEQQEIIEIGICTLDIKTCQRYKKDSILVRPEQSTVGPFCTRLTTLTQQQLEEEGVSFAEAVERVRQEYSPWDRTWASYGDFDRILFQRECSERGIAFPLGRTHINVKNLLAIGLNLPYEIGLDTALDKLHLPLEGTHHRGHDDAWNIAAVLGLLLTSLRNMTDMV